MRIAARHHCYTDSLILSQDTLRVLTISRVNECGPAKNFRVRSAAAAGFKSCVCKVNNLRDKRIALTPRTLPTSIMLSLLRPAFRAAPRLPALVATRTFLTSFPRLSDHKEPTLLGEVGTTPLCPQRSRTDSSYTHREEKLEKSPLI